MDKYVPLIDILTVSYSLSSIYWLGMIVQNTNKQVRALNLINGGVLTLLTWIMNSSIVSTDIYCTVTTGLVTVDTPGPRSAWPGLACGRGGWARSPRRAAPCPPPEGVCHCHRDNSKVFTVPGTKKPVLGASPCWKRLLAKGFTLRLRNIYLMGVNPQ